MKIKSMQTIMVLIFAFVLGLAGVSSGGQTEDMQDDLAMRASLLQKFNKKHERALVNAAQDERFKKYFTAQSDDEKKKLKGEIDQLSLAVQSKFNVDEMCLIDKKGQEISRIVFKEVAPDADLSPDEASADFFKPSMGQKARKVHIQKPYMSADSLRWVVCYTTPIVLGDGSKPGFYHFEVPLYSIQKAVNRGLDGEEGGYLLLVNNQGYIMSDSREQFKLELDKSDKEMKAPLKDYFPVLSDNDMGGLASEIKKGGEGTGSFEQNGKKYTLAYSPAGYFDWSLVLVHKEE